MSPLEEALRELVGFLESERVPYMVIGGVANLVWGVPRSTLDVDVTILVPPQDEAAVVGRLIGRFTPLPPDPIEFLRQTRVLPVKVKDFRADVILGGLPYEERAVARAKPVAMAGITVKVASPEDLVVHKIVSERPRDLEDARGVVRRLGPSLDRAYLDPIIRGLSAELAQPAIWERYCSCWLAL